jgi:uncharacterized membrane protein YbhN (UPF0104 family)
VVHGARISRPPRRIAGALGLCVVAWLLDATVYWLAARSIGLEIAPVGAVLISAVTVLATAVPSAPAYVGTFELAVVAVAGVLGVDPSAALAYALIVHGIAILPITLAGVVALAAIGRDARSARIVSAPVLGR